MGAFAPDVVGSQITEEERAAVLRTATENGRWQGEIRHTRRDGTPIIVEVTSMALRDDSGRIFAHVAVNRDTTERKRVEEQLRASREQLQNLSHQLVRLQESERSYVANRLDNDEGQRLSALLLGLGLMEREVSGDLVVIDHVAELKEMTGGILADMHSLAVNLRPASLDQQGLAAALVEYADEFGRQHELQIEKSSRRTSRRHACGRKRRQRCIASCRKHSQMWPGMRRRPA
jgi:signal transduction histidine kinase